METVGVATDEGGEAEVGDFDVAVLVEKQVLRLDITMTNVVAVDVADSLDELAEKLARFIFLETSVFEDVVEEFAVGNVFDYDKDLRGERGHDHAILWICSRGLR